MKKILSFFLSVLTLLAAIGFLNCIINYFFLWENNGEKYYKKYIENSKQIKVRVDEKYFGKEFSHTSYLKYTIYYKGITGGSEDETFKDNYTNKYFKIMRFDLRNLTITGGQSSSISGKDLYVMVNNDEINNSAFGTITNPIHVFTFKGVEKRIEVNKENGKDKMIWISLEPTQKEYENNVIQYLTYVMSGKEFKERFEK